jgi:hypothetical protein
VRGTLLLTLVLLFSACWLYAQEGDPGADIWVSVDTYPPTIDGCLQRYGFYYKVIGEDGTVYNLTHTTSEISHYVGHQVEITGKPTVKTLDTTEIHIASSVEELPALEVKSVKELSATCSPVKTSGPPNTYLSPLPLEILRFMEIARISRKIVILKVLTRKILSRKQLRWNVTGFSDLAGRENASDAIFLEMVAVR